MTGSVVCLIMQLKRGTNMLFNNSQRNDLVKKLFNILNLISLQRIVYYMILHFSIVIQFFLANLTF